MCYSMEVGDQNIPRGCFDVQSMKRVILLDHRAPALKRAGLGTDLEHPGGKGVL
jgi:hypothetical protein